MIAFTGREYTEPLHELGETGVKDDASQDIGAAPDISTTAGKVLMNIRFFYTVCEMQVYSLGQQLACNTGRGTGNEKKSQEVATWEKKGDLSPQFGRKPFFTATRRLLKYG
jgi:hypothetical protein